MRREDVWANVETAHLTSRERREATEDKEAHMKIQAGREFIVTKIDDGSDKPWDHYIDTLAQLETFVRRATEKMNQRPTPVILETRGESDLWEER